MAELTAVVPTRNRVHTLERTLGSILDQRDVDLDVVVVDEASSDDTPDYLTSLGDQVRVIRNEVPVGLPAARNLGLRAARSRYVAFCDDDDLWSPDKSRAQIDAIAATPGARWALCGATLVTADLALLGHLRRQDADDLLRDLLQHNVVPASGSGMLMETELALDVGGFDEGLKASEDWDMAVRLALAAPAAVADGPHVAYRVYAGSMSSSAPRMRASFEAMRARYAPLAAEHGVELDEVAYETFVAQQEVKGGHRLGGARTYLALASREGDPRHLARAALALTAPAWLDRKGDARSVKRIPAHWAAVTEDWIARVPRATSRGLVPVD